MMLLLLLVAAISGVRSGGGPIFTQGPDGSGKVGFTPPDLSDENTHSHFLPDRLRCAGCKAVAYQLFKAFRETDRKRPSLRSRFPESLVYRITDQVCEEKEAFEKYGLRSINDEQELFGPGMDVVDDAPGVKQEGGMWPSRLRDMCTEFIDRLGDKELFRHYRSKNKLEQYTNYLCYNTGVRGICKDQTEYRLPKKLEGEDVFTFKHDTSRPLADADIDDEEDEEYYADDYEEDYDEDDYDGNDDESELDRMKRRAKRKEKRRD